MEAFLTSTVIVAVAEMGDKTQLLSFLLAARFRKPWPILAGILLATLANHFLAGAVGAWIATWIPGEILKWVVAVSFFAFGLWALKPDELGEDPAMPAAGVFLATLVAVVLGTTFGMMLANAPAVWIGEKLAHRVNMKLMRWTAAALFWVLGVLALLAWD